MPPGYKFGQRRARSTCASAQTDQSSMPVLMVTFTVRIRPKDPFSQGIAETD